MDFSYGLLGLVGYFGGLLSSRIYYDGINVKMTEFKGIVPIDKFEPPHIDLKSEKIVYPYRNSVRPVIVDIDSGKPQGYVIYPKKHECKTPGFLARLFRGVKEDDEWWCECGLGYSYRPDYPNVWYQNLR